MDSFLQRHAGDVIGVLSGFDRLLFRGTLRSISYGDGLDCLLAVQRVKYRDFKAFAMGLSDLHGDALDQARVGNSLTKATALNEKGEPVKGFGDMPNQHDMLTGSQPDGRAFTDSADHTCNNWTSSTDGTAMLGHFDRTGGPNVSWNAAHPSGGCSQEALVRTGGAGLFYCFATDAPRR